jgi:hypothetical protein
MKYRLNGGKETLRKGTLILLNWIVIWNSICDTLL